MRIPSRTYSTPWALSLAAVATITLLCIGCAPLISTVATPAFTTSTYADESPTETKLILWHAWRTERQEILNSIINEFDCRNPDIEVSAIPLGPSAGSVAERMLLRSGARRSPDLALVERDAVPLLVEAGLIRPLDDLLAPQTESDNYFRKENLLDPALAHATYEGRLYGLPAYLNPYVLIHNSEKIPEPPTDWDALIGLGAVKESSPGPKRWALSVRSMAPVFHILCAQKGVDPLEADSDENAAAAVKDNLEFIRSLRRKPSVLPPQYKHWDPNFAGVADGRALTQIDTAIRFAYMKHGSARPLAAAAVPSDAQPSRTALARSPVFVVSGASDSAAAMEFLEFFYSPERYARFVEELMVVSPWKDLFGASNDLAGDSAFDGKSYSRIVSAAENAVVYPLRGRTGKIMPRIARTVDRLDAGLISTDEAKREIFEAVKEKNEAPKSPRPASIHISWAESTRRLLADDGAGAHPPPVRISAARNERESFQLAISADGEIDGLSLDFAPFVSADAIPAAVRMDAALIEDTRVAKPLVAPEAGLYPNVLRPFDEFGVLPGKLTRIWIDATIDESVPPGEYSSRITIRQGERVAAEIPVGLRALPLKIPKTPSQPAFMGLNYDLIANYYGIDEGPNERRELMDAFYWFLVERRMTPLNPPAPPDSPEIASYMSDERVSGLRLPFDPAEKRFEKAVRLADEGGWLDKTFSYVIDEPTYHQYDGVLEAARRIRSAPVSPRLLVACFPDDPLIGAVDIWLIHLRFLPEGIPRGHMERTEYAAAVARRLGAGDEVWWYTAGATAPFPTLHVEDDPAAFRIIPWMQQIYGVGGFLHWETANWRRPIDDPYISFFGNGEGVLIYPGEEGPLSSIRLELLREGLEDMEHLTLLGGAIEGVQRELGAEELGDAAAIRVGELCRRLIEDDALRASTSNDLLLLPHFSREPGLIERVREEVAEEIISVGARPRAIVLTAPEEKQYTGSESARIFGMVERGCRVEINGRDTPVDETGGFSATFPLHGGTNDFRILLRNGEHTKLIDRKIEKF